VKPLSELREWFLLRFAFPNPLELDTLIRGLRLPTQNLTELVLRNRAAFAAGDDSLVDKTEVAYIRAPLSAQKFVLRACCK
jgi:hypothetical protein